MKVKRATRRGNGPPPPGDVAAVVDKIAKSSNDDDLITILDDIPVWRYPRGDLHTWIPVLDRFDDVLATIIQSYELSKLQTNDFTPKTKELLLGILRVTRLLLENCTSRKLYSSYDRIADLLLTTDLDVLLSTILLLLRPSQQYGTAIPVEGQLGPRLANRILTLTRGWEQYHDAGFNALQLASAELIEPPTNKVSLQFYPEEGPKASITNLDLEISQFETPDQIAEIAEEHNIPVDDQLSLLNKARLLTLVRGRETRRQLLAIRYLSIATYIYMVSEEVSMSTIFLYETALVQQLSEVMVPNREVGDWVLSAALYAMDACAHHRQKLPEVLSTVGANVSHGKLISLLRDIVQRLTIGGEDSQGENVLFEVLDAMMGFIAYVATSPPHSNHIIGAGIIPLLLELPKTRVDRRDNYIPRAMGLLDAMVFTAQQGMTALSNADGINSLVEIVKSELELLLSKTVPEPTYAISEDTIKFYMTTPIKSALRVIHRLMQMPGPAEGMRNLVDSELPKLLKRIFENSPKFGNRVFSLAINTMATFVHNEPTSLAILQELQLPQALYQELEREFPTSFDVLFVVPTAIGAICLNQVGMDYTLAHPRVVEEMVVAAMSSESHAVQLGQYLDELARHHPPLRSLVLKATLDQLRQACEQGARFTPEEKDRQSYLLESSDIAGQFDKPVENDALNKLLKIFTVLQGTMRNSTLSKEFVQAGGLKLLLDTADLPCIPMHLGHGPGGLYGTVLGMLQTIGEHDYTEVATALLDSVIVAMNKVQDIWKEGHPWDDLGDRLPVLRGLIVRLSNLSNYFISLPPTQHRSVLPMLKAVGAASNGSFLKDAGEFHRTTMSAVSTFKVREGTEEDTPMDDAKGSAAKYLSSRLYTGFTKVFRSFIRLLFHKRTPEPSQRKEAQAISQQITDILIGHCEYGKKLEGPSAVVYDTVALGTALHQLFDDRGHEGHLNTILFLVFEKQRGVTHLFALMERLVETLDQPNLEGANKIRATAGATVALDLLLALVRPKALVTNPQTQILQQRADEAFNPTELLIKIRRDAFPLAKRVWTSDALAKGPSKLAHAGAKTFLTIMEGKDEEAQQNSLAAPRPFNPLGLPILPTVRTPVVADPARVDQLVDMGFPRGSAERALVRARNNVAAAADMILSMPHVFEGAEPAASADAPPAAPPATDAAASADAAPETTTQNEEAADADAAPPVGTEPSTQDRPVGDDIANVEAGITEPQQPDVDTSMDVDEAAPEETPVEPVEDIKKALNAMREEAKGDVPIRALKLLDGGDELLFDLMRAFPSDQSGLNFLLKNIRADEESQLSRRMRLFSLLCVHNHVPELSDENASLAYGFIKSMPIDAVPRPPWLTALLLFAETVMILCTNTKDTAIGDPIDRITAIIRVEDKERLLIACQTIFADPDSKQEELLSAYRCMIILSRLDVEFDFVHCLAPFKHGLDERLSRCHGALSMILRHVFEDEATLEEVMRREIRNYLHKDKTTDVKHFVKQLRQVTARDSDTFVNAVEKECALLDPAPLSQNYHIRAKEPSKTVASSDPFQAEAMNPTMSFLVTELGTAAKSTLEDENIAPGYTGLVSSLLTEVTGSYMSAKKAFMASLRLSGLYGQPKARSGISSIINDLVCCVDIRRDLAQEGQKQDPTRRMTISGWAMTLLVALCSDLTPTSDMKSVSEDLITIRRTVLDALIKVLKDSATLEPNVRYGKLWAIGELVYRLLTAKPSITPHQHDDSALQIAKAMVEKNFVGLMTEATSNVDLNYPNIKVALLSLLRALDHLSKVSIKWNKVEKTKGQGASVDEQSAPSSSSDEESDVDMLDVDEEAPDLYRNSALGILGGEMDEDSEGEEEEDEDDDMMELYGDEIDEDDDLGTEPSSDEDMDDVDEVMEDEEDWTDDDEEDEDGEEEEVETEPQVVIGTEDAEPIWETQEGEEAILGEEDDHESMLSHGDPGTMEAFQAFLDGVDGLAEDVDEGDEDEELMMDEDEDPEDFLEDMDHAGVEATFHPPSANTGAWGWSADARGGRSDRPRSRLLIEEEPMTALFGGAPRPGGQELAQHPLLVNPAHTERRDRLRIPGMSSTDDGLGSLEERMGPEAARLIESVLHRHRHAGRHDLRIGFSQAPDGGVGLQIDGRVYTFPPPDRQNGDQQPSQSPLDISTEFIPKPSMQRWHDEMVVCGEDSAKLVNHIINRLLPEARERAQEEAEKAKKAEDEAQVAEAKAEEERKQAEEAKEKEDAEKRETERLATEAVATSTALPESRVPTPAQDVEMTDTTATTEPPSTTTTEGASETAAPPRQAADAETPQPGEASADHSSLARTIITIHGRDVDITGTGIDLEFLQALPDEMRADVVEQHMREHNRHRRPEQPEDSSAAQVSPEFLDALPPDIRNEVLLQQQLESQRRARADRPATEPATGPPAPPGAPPGRNRNVRPELQAIEDMVASLGQNTGMTGGEPSLAELLNGESSSEFLAGLTNELREVMMDGGGLLNPLRRGPLVTSRALGKPETSTKKPKRDAVQLLDKPGVASLVRLLFFPEAFKRDYLLRVLVNLCENSTTRVDLLNLLLSVVQDGTGDLPAVDKSFAQMSLKPGTTPKSTPRNTRMPDTPAASAGTTALFARLQSDQIPAFIAQRCFQALTHIVGSNSQAVTYFLTEHEQPVGLRKPPSKKGKGKERLIPQTKFPIVVLLDFLDRSLLLKTSGMMESFAALLASITKPLANLKKADEKGADEAGASNSQAPAETGEQNATSTPAAPSPPVMAPTAPTSSWAPRIQWGAHSHSTPGGAETQTPGGARKAEDASANQVTTGLTSPPQIPPATLRLVVNCLTLGDCTSRTFGYTLSIIQNLSVVPDAKRTILDELHARAQRLGQTIHEELKELKFTLKGSGDAIDAASLVKFSPPSSSQAQLLRLLKTIDYIHSEKVDSDPPGETMTESEKAIGKAFDAFDFEPMWKQLSECLAIVDDKGRTDQISTVLLPLVEALMVICKYRRPEVSRETRSPSEPPSSAIEPDNLFVSFTTTHRKVLNAIVRTNPGLLSGSFSLLVRNPRVLEFDNKRNWFLQKLKRKRDQPAHPPVLHLNIRRQYVFEDSFRALERRTGEEVKYGKLSVKFYNEDGIDAGGVTREWFSVLAQQIFDPNFALFEPCAADGQTYQPNKASSVNGEHLSYFKFVGRVIGKAVFDGRLLDAYFSRAFYKQILGKTVDMRDLESIDPEYHKSLQWMLDNDITDVIDQEFTIEDDQFGEKKVVELKEGGGQIPVTEENKAEYVRLVVSYRIENSIKDQIKAFLNGFYEIIPRNLIQIFEADQLELLISGITSIDVDELKNATQMAGWKGSDPEIGWFWRALRSFSQEERARFLMFVTSSSRVPLGGFTQLQGASGIQPFQIQKLYSKEGSLPQASTCFNLLLLPKYESYEQLREKLQFAVYETGGFGKA